ncbi:hypothetical protein D9757_009650 [Collybiopsis confluens]|uniref:Uncharacterized protein n=1 Tax=Collybiopsis confluens TaxID=2823264 RepID=A0A8H5LWV1_9AGAR|nr:hypothetical protein D9757_009650 [Collybiopsis confluens]
MSIQTASTRPLHTTVDAADCPPFGPTRTAEELETIVDQQFSIPVSPPADTFYIHAEAHIKTLRERTEKLSLADTLHPKFSSCLKLHEYVPSDGLAVVVFANIQLLVEYANSKRVALEYLQLGVLFLNLSQTLPENSILAPKFQRSLVLLELFPKKTVLPKELGVERAAEDRVDIVADAILIFRLYAVWGFRKRVIIAPLTITVLNNILAILDAAIRLKVVIIVDGPEDQVMSESDIFWAENATTMTLAFMIVNLLVNTLVTSLIESGMLYPVAILLALVLLHVLSHCPNLFAILAEVVAIAPTLIIVPPEAEALEQGELGNDNMAGKRLRLVQEMLLDAGLL